MRPPELGKHTLAIHPRRKRRELLSSWILRLAQANRWKVHTLGVKLGGNQAPIWNRDIDRMAPPWLLQRLSELTARPVEEIYEATLSDLADKISDGHHPNGHAAWILPLGIWHRRRRRFGVQFCSLCFFGDKEPYIRRDWRLAYYTECEDHHVLLSDRCGACGQPHTYFRAELGERLKIRAEKMNICTNCGFDLGKNPIARFEWPEWQLAVAIRNLHFINDFGYAFLDGRNFEQASDLLVVVRQIIKVISSAEPCGELFDAIADQLWPQGYAVLGQRGMIYEHRSVLDRHRLFGMAVWLLQDWPNRFEMCVSNARIHRHSLLGQMKNPPEWYRLQCVSKMRPNRWGVGGAA